MPPPKKAPGKAKPPSPPKPAVKEKKAYCFGLAANPAADGELYWNDPRAASSSQFAARYLAHEEERTELIAKRDAAVEAEAIAIYGRSKIKKKANGGKTRMLSRSPSPEEGRGNVSGYIDNTNKDNNSSAASRAGAELHHAITSSQPTMSPTERDEYYTRTFPYNYLGLDELKETTSSVDRVFFIQSQTGAERSKTMEAVILALRFLEDTERVDLKRCIFADLMAFGGEALLYASAFNFPRLITLELSESSKMEATRIIKLTPGLYERSTILIGSFTDYFPVDANIYYMDMTRVVQARKMGDEGVLVDLAFRLFKTLLPGAFFVLITSMTDFSPSRDFDAPHLKRRLKQTVHQGCSDECTLWIFVVDFK